MILTSVGFCVEENETAGRIKGKEIQSCLILREFTAPRKLVYIYFLF
jgi:hypothetical protein